MVLGLKDERKVIIMIVVVVISVYIVSDPPVESRKPTLDMLSTQNINSRIEIAATSVSRSAIAVLISKYEATVETKFLMDMDSESA